MIKRIMWSLKKRWHIYLYRYYARRDYEDDGLYKSLEHQFAWEHYHGLLNPQYWLEDGFVWNHREEE